MKTLKLTNDLYWCGIQDSKLRVFDIIMSTEFGTTYNSYILKAGDKTILFETAKVKFLEEYLEAVRSITDFDKIDYIVVSHTEPDHVGSIEKILEINPNLKIIATQTAIGFLKHIVNRDFYSIAVKDNESMIIGNKTLKFMVLPNLHWPDTMYTYIEEEKALVTCDSFGAHYSHEGILRSTLADEEGYKRALKYYFDMIIGPFRRPFMVAGLNKIKDLDIDLICTGHGPVLDKHIDYVLKMYEEWSNDESPFAKKTVVIPYVSAYGYTRALAEEISKGIKDSGDVDVLLYDMVEADAGKVLSDLYYADGILFGTPTIVGEALKPIWDLTTSMHAQMYKGKLASAFGSYGWSGEGVPHILERFKQIKLKVLDGFTVRLKPDKNQLIDAYEFGYNFGCVLQNKENDKLKKTTKLLKCLVCGQVFEEGTTVCPVCGVGPENFISIDIEENTFFKDTEERFLIIGGGAAAVSAAVEIRNRNKTCGIVMLSSESYLPYNRPMLTKNMFAGFTNEQIAVKDKAWYEENNITFVLNCKVTKISADKKEIETESGAVFSYSKCIYAAGSSPFVPPFKGVEQDGVLTVRTIDDVENIKSHVGHGVDIIVIGGGILGLEAAWELKKAGCIVTVVETAPRLLAGKLDEAASELLQKVAATNDVKIVTSTNVEEISGDGKVSGVLLSDGTKIPCNLVVVSCGIRANIGLAKDAGLNTARAVVVDKFMKTSDDNIFACGDCAEFEGINFALWAEATEMGKVAGANTAGDLLEYKNSPLPLTMNALNTSVYSIGDCATDSNKQYKTVESKDSLKNTLDKYYFLNNRLVGVTLIGSTVKVAEMTKAVVENRLFKDMF